LGEKKPTKPARAKPARQSAWVAEKLGRDGNVVRKVIESLKREDYLPEDTSTIGVVLLTSEQQFLYMNRQAQQLCQHLTWAENGDTGNGALPPALSDLRTEVLKQLDRASHIKDWESVELSRVVGNSERPILLRGVGFPDSVGASPVCVLILMEEVGNRVETAPLQAKERFQLTAREQAAVQYLAKGCTNRQIADALGISEPTVKEHLRNIMQKTGTRTRTGILVRVLGR